jgi:GPH family glycoside/pentoside/hexuronide:cation symporter
VAKRTLSLWQTLAYSSGNFPVNLISQMFATYAVFFYVDHLGVRPGLISLAMVFHGIVSAVTNPIVGHISDRTKSRWGRRKPYMIAAMLPALIAFTLIWMPFVEGESLFWYFLITVLLYDIAAVVLILNWTALFPEMFMTLKERATASFWRQLFGIIGMIVGVAIPPLLYTSVGWASMGISFGVLSIVFFVIAWSGSEERAEVNGVKFNVTQAIRHTFANQAFVRYVLGSFCVQFCFALLPAAIPFFTKYVLREAETFNTVLLGTLFIIAIVFIYPWSRGIARWGTRNIALWTTGLLGAALVPFMWVGHLPGAIATVVALGAVLAGLMVLLDVMLAEVIDEDERRTGERREGMYYGMNGFIVRWGVSLQAVVMGVVLERSGYMADGANQPESVEAGIRWMLSGIPILALLIGLIFFYIYPLRNKNINSSNQQIK